MPFTSQAQRRKFYADPKLRRYVPEFEAATPKGVKLPERSGARHVQVRAHVRRHPGTAKKGPKMATAAGKPAGSGANFAKVKAAAAASGARNPGAVAAAVGRNKYGAKGMAKLAAAGRKRRGAKLAPARKAKTAQAARFAALDSMHSKAMAGR